MNMANRKHSGGGANLQQIIFSGHHSKNRYVIDTLPSWIPLLFLSTFVLTVALFHYANGKPRWLTLMVVGWSVLQCALAYSGFYQITDTIPPRFGLVLIPPAILIVYGLLPAQRKWALSNRNIQISTFLHSVRVPVEMVLFGLFVNRMIPELMTFEGRNFDIVMGITAPVMGWFFLKNRLSRRTLLYWNVLGLLLVSFVLCNGILSAELPFQQFGFEQPNRAMNYFPFVLLPSTIVPIVVWTHVIDIIKLRSEIGTIKP